MPYTNFTPNYKIPFWAASEKSSGQSNRRAALIVDNQLTAASALLGDSGIMQEGVYTPTFVSGNSTVNLLATGTNYAMQAIISGVFIQQNTTLSWTGILNNTTSYLYVITDERNLYSSNEFSSLQNKTCKTTFNTNGVTPPNSLLVGKVVTTSIAITLDTSATVSDSGTFSAGKPLIFPLTVMQSSVDSFSRDIPVIKTQLSGLSITTASIQTVLSGLSGTPTSITSIQSVVSGLSTSVSTIQSSVDSLDVDVPMLKTMVSGLNAEYLAYRVTTQTSDYTAVLGDVVLSDTTSGFTITLPSVAGIVRPFPIKIKKISSDANLLTITGSQNIDGVASLGIIDQWSGISLMPSPTQWYII